MNKLDEKLNDDSMNNEELLKELKTRGWGLAIKIISGDTGANYKEQMVYIHLL